MVAGIIATCRSDWPAHKGSRSFLSMSIHYSSNQFFVFRGWVGSSCLRLDLCRLFRIFLGPMRMDRKAFICSLELRDLSNRCKNTLQLSPKVSVFVLIWFSSSYPSAVFPLGLRAKGVSIGYVKGT